MGFLLFFSEKWANERFAQKNKRFAHFWWATWANRSWLLIFGEQPERFAHSHSFVMSNLNDSLTSLFKKREWAKRSFFKNLQKTFKKGPKIQFYSNLFEWITRFLWVKEWMSDLLKKTSNLLMRSFIMSDLSKSLMVTLFFHERPEEFAHGHSFVMIDLSDLRTAAHLSWAIWANCSQLLIKMRVFERMREWTMSKWANSQPWPLDLNCILSNFRSWL